MPVGITLPPPMWSPQISPEIPVVQMEHAFMIWVLPYNEHPDLTSCDVARLVHHVPAEAEGVREWERTRAQESRVEGTRESRHKRVSVQEHMRGRGMRERDGDRTHLDKTLRYTLVQDRLALEPQAVAPRETA